ncbi:hypothetical protein JXQ31_09515 [candidate division KSB1 bacterium]|nr:hypothetical protein [candidate division KSB1 bacterium]
MKFVKTINLKILIIIFNITLLFFGTVNAQEKIINLNLSRYYYRVSGPNEGMVDYDENEHSGMFPNGTYYMWTVSEIYEFLLFGHIILANGEEQRNYQRKLGDGYYQEAPFGVREISKYPPPQVFVDGAQSTPDFDGIIDPDIKADKMFIVYRKQSPWMHLRNEGYQFVNQYYGDFMIMNSTYKLTFDDDAYPETSPDLDADTTQTVTDFYVLKAYRVGQTSITGKTGTDPNGKWFINHGAYWASTMVTPSLTGVSSPRKDLVITYGWDGNHPNVTQFTTGGPPFDDTGEPRFTPIADGDLISTNYSGFALLHCDISPDDKSDWVPNNPYGSYVHVRHLHFSADAVLPGGKTTWDYFISPGPQSLPYQLSTWEDGSDTNPITLESKTPAQVWGGWKEMKMGDSVSVVHAIGSGSISRQEARTLGAKWAKWYQSGDVPDAYYDDNVSSGLGNVLATDDIKNQIVARGKDSLKVAMQRAQELWENNLECPRPYPSPDLYVTSGPYSCTLEWDDIGTKYPDHEGGNVIAYRIYRKIGHVEDEYPTEAGQNLYWERIKEIPVDSLATSPKGLFMYVDAGLEVGEDYHYAVTAVSDKRCGIDGTGPYLESSQWSNRSTLPARPIIPGKDNLNQIAVVPNPYYIYGQLMNFSSDNNRLMFVNLPPYCTLKIYNVTGDLVHTLVHDDGSSVDFWDQITQNNQFIASGVYILVVSDAQKLIADESGNLTIRQKLSDKAIIKFTIIR